MAGTSFYDGLPRHRDFAALADPKAFEALPQDWLAGCTDLVDSTGLIEAGHYKTVNMIGASAIAALMNAFEGEPFPYVFGGDGASFAVPPHLGGIARGVLGRLRSWTAAEFPVELRAALLPVSWIRAEGLDVRVARYAVSGSADYAMFAGGGMAWAERQMKSGAFEVQPSADAAPPDLAGLSCRWSNIPARNGIILSLVMEPAPGADPADFARIAGRVLNMAGELDRAGHPVPETGPPLRFPPPGFSLEAKMSRGRKPLWLRKAALFADSALAAVLLRRGRPTGKFDPAHYTAVLSANSDFRKFEDGLKMTIDCSADTRARIQALLHEAQDAGLVRYGLHAQDEAMVTCIVPSPMRDDHVHFVDGAAGGYTRAAAGLQNGAPSAQDRA